MRNRMERESSIRTSDDEIVFQRPLIIAVEESHLASEANPSIHPCIHSCTRTTYHPELASDDATRGHCRQPLEQRKSHIAVAKSINGLSTAKSERPIAAAPYLRLPCVEQCLTFHVCELEGGENFLLQLKGCRQKQHVYKFNTICTLGR